MENAFQSDQVLALAGIFQATSLVQQVARHGGAERDPFEASIYSIFQIDADSAEDVFGGRRGLEHGLNVLCDQLGRQRHERDAELSSYAIGLLFLERKLNKRPDLINTIRQDIDVATAQTTDSYKTHESVLAKLADIYSNTISTLTPRIMVKGDPQHLNNPSNAHKIRSLLLSGIRATVLWRQVGGNRLSLLLSRSRIVFGAQAILSDLRDPEA